MNTFTLTVTNIFADTVYKHLYGHSYDRISAPRGSVARRHNFVRKGVRNQVLVQVSVKEVREGARNVKVLASPTNN